MKQAARYVYYLLLILPMQLNADGGISYIRVYIFVLSPCESATVLMCNYCYAIANGSRKEGRLDTITLYSLL